MKLRKKKAGRITRPLLSSLKTNAKKGLYDPLNEHDSCGLGFIANVKGLKSHKIVVDGIKILENLEHRGATGADPLMGDGAGMLVQIPHSFFFEECLQLGFQLPSEGHYCVGFFFTPKDESIQKMIKKEIEELSFKAGQPLIGWRAVPTCNSKLSQDPEIMSSEPMHWQGFFSRPKNISDDAYERKIYTLRRHISNIIRGKLKYEQDFYPVSMSSRTIVYKGMFFQRVTRKLNELLRRNYAIKRGILL